MENEIKNYGFSLGLERAHAEDTDHIFGAASLPSLFVIPKEERRQYKPKGEVQHGVEDFMDCATRSPLNKLETDFNYGYRHKLFTPENLKWLEDKGYVNANGEIEFSDRFIAVKSGTTRQGNSLKAPIDAIHSYGLIPKSMLPARSDMTWDQYHNKGAITPEMEKLGKEFKERFTILYEKVREEDLEIIYEYDELCLAGFAWPEPVNGEYPRVSLVPNHAFMGIEPKTYIFDNYIDSVDGDFIKKLASDYDFYDVAYRVFISTENPNPQPKKPNWFKEILKNLWDFILFFLPK